MSGFYLACGLLLLLAVPFVLLPMAGRRVADDRENANRQWFRLRQAELDATADSALVEDAKLRLLEDAAPGGEPAGSASTRRFRSWLLLPLLFGLSAGLYYLLGAAPDVQITRQLNALDENTTPAQLDSLMADIRARIEQRPENLEYTVLLGRFAMQEQDYASAVRYFDALVAAAPGDAAALAYAAQASYLAAGRQLDNPARLRAEQALAVDPHQRTALGLLGMASFEQGQYRAAVAYWERLLAVEPPGSPSHQMIASVIDTARARLAGAGEPHAAAASVGVTIEVSLPEGAAIDPAATVFVLARDGAGNSRMPIAVQRVSAGQLPLSVRLDDGNSMAGQKISSYEAVRVEVQVSPDGTPGAAKATWLGQAGPLTPGGSSAPVAIQLSPNPQS